VIIDGWREPGWQVFAADPRCCAQARSWVRRAITAWPTAADPDDAALTVSELFGNATKHGPGGSVLVACCLWRAGARIIVCDAGGRGAPHLRDDARPGQEDGRGLYTVNAVSARWGTFVCGQSRVVWSDLAQPLAATGTQTWGWLPGILAEVSLTPSQVVAAEPARAS
jgi:anti-sigma regulatory factor (Ser/Thr protein kinase)